jgi:hydrogenase-4 component I
VREAELVALGNVVFDLGRFGVQFVASPRHADGIVVTGAVNRNMREALQRTYAAVPDPRLVIAVGACASSGGPFRESPEVLGGVSDTIPVDLWIPGCPPHPLTVLDGLLRLLGRLG